MSSSKFYIMLAIINIVTATLLYLTSIEPSIGGMYLSAVPLLLIAGTQHLYDRYISRIGKY